MSTIPLTQRQHEPMRAPRMGTVYIAFATILLGLVWGVISQALRDLRLADGWPLMSLWLLVVLALFLFAVYRLRLVKAPLTTGLLAAFFLVSAVTSHYGYYIATLAMGLGKQGASLDMSEEGTYRMLRHLFKTSIAQWLLLAGIGGFGVGWLLSSLMMAFGRVRGADNS